MKRLLKTSHPKAVTAPSFHSVLQCFFLFMKFITTWCHIAKTSLIIHRRWTNCNVNMKSNNCFLLQVSFTVTFCLLELFPQRPLHHCASTEKHHFSSSGLLETVSLWTSAPTISHEVEGCGSIMQCSFESQHFWLQPNQFRLTFIYSFQLPCQHLFSLLRVPAHTTSQHSVYCNKNWCQKS